MEFTETNYNVSEGSGNVTVCVRKDLEVAKEFSVTVMSRERSPVDAKGIQLLFIIILKSHNYKFIYFISDSEDFYGITIPVTFPAGNTNTVCQNVEIIDDNITLEASEEFLLDLIVPLIMSLQGSFELGLSTKCMMAEEESTVDSSTITIMDNDGKCSSLIKKGNTRINDSGLILCVFFPVLVLSFTSVTYEVTEDAGSVSVCIEKNKDTAEEVFFNIIAEESDPVDAKGYKNNSTLLC